MKELLGQGVEDAEYDAWLINILEGEQFGSGYVATNPNSIIPALVDCGVAIPVPIPIFKPGAILLYLAELD